MTALNINNGQFGVVNLFSAGTWNMATTQTPRRPARYIQVLEASVIASAPDLSLVTGGTAISNLSLTAGTILEGRFTSVQLTSGKVRLYLDEV